MIVQLSCGCEKAISGGSYGAFASNGYCAADGGDFLVEKTLETIHELLSADTLGENVQDGPGQSAAKDKRTGFLYNPFAK